MVNWFNWEVVIMGTTAKRFYALRLDMCVLVRFDWEVVVVEDKTPNAFVLPGGKIVVFTGERLHEPGQPYPTAVQSSVCRMMSW